MTKAVPTDPSRSGCRRDAVPQALGGARGDLPPYQDLARAESDLWQRLGRAVRDRRSPWHTPVLATVAADGGPSARVVVLRGADRAARVLRIHTDRRSAKVAEIAACAPVALVFYDAGARLQLRVSGRARVETDGPAADAAWAGTRLLGRRCYTSPVGPGAPAPGPVSGLPPGLEGREPTPAESEAGRANFAIVLVEAERLEFLHLAFTGHCRGAFRWCPDAARWQGGWLIP